MLTRIGVTGGIGSGKSEVCKTITSFDIPLIQADIIARHLTDSDPSVKKDILALLGSSSYDASTGALDRALVASLIFGDRKKLRALNAIVHPRVLTSVAEELEVIEKRRKSGYVLVEAALMFESGLAKQMDYVLTVAAEDTRRIGRVRKRSDMTEEQFRAVVESQIPVEVSIESSDFVIHNNGTFDELRRKAAFFHTIFSALKPHQERDNGHSR